MKTAVDEPRCAVLDSEGNVVNVIVANVGDIPEPEGMTHEDVSGLPVSKGWKKDATHGYHRRQMRQEVDPDTGEVTEREVIQRVKRDANGKAVFPDKRPSFAEVEEADG